jgi:hypothetical protein
MADNFTPGETIPVNATTSGASVSFSLAQSANYPDVLVTNAGDVIAFVGFGAAAQVPSGTNATPVMAGETMVFRKGIGVTQCSGITGSGSAQLYFTAGEGS